MDRLTGSSLLVGLLAMVRYLGAGIFSLLAGNWNRSLKYKKTFLIKYSALSRLPIWFLGLYLIFFQNDNVLFIGLFIILIQTLFWSGDGGLSTAWIDVVGKTIDPYQRGKFFSIRQILSGIIAIFAGYLIRINHFKNLINSKYLNYFLNSYEAKRYGNEVKTDGVNQSNINGDKLTKYPFPLTSLREQNQIVQEIEQRLSVADNLEKTIEESLKKAEALRQSIRKKAFEGKLTEEWRQKHPELVTGENSAERLLERIKEEKEKVTKK